MIRHYRDNLVLHSGGKATLRFYCFTTSPTLKDASMTSEALDKPPEDDDFTKFLIKLKAKLSHIKKPHIMLVTCFDLRYPVLIHEHMETAAGGWFHQKYDHMSLAGSGLAGVVTFPPHPKPHWSSTFIEQVALSVKLHRINALVVLEHRTCGAYKEFGLLTDSSTTDEETKAHMRQTDRLKELIHKDYPDLLFYPFLLEALEHPAEKLIQPPEPSKGAAPAKQRIAFTPLGDTLT